MEPSLIRLGHVVRKAEPTFRIAECFDAERNTCVIAPVCSLKPVLNEALNSCLTTLDRFTLADLLAGGAQRKLSRVFTLNERPLGADFCMMSSISSIADVLKKTALFSALSDVELRSLATRTLIRSYTPGELLFSEGTSCEGLYIVSKRRVRIFKTSPAGRGAGSGDRRSRQFHRGTPGFRRRTVSGLGHGR